jgi:hypothetical protein
MADYNAIFNSSKYAFKTNLVSNDGRSQELKPGVVRQLVISDSFLNFYTAGYAVVDNSFDGIERNTPENINNNNRGFVFKGDSRDFLTVDIMPNLNDSAYAGSSKKEQADKLFRIQSNFAIYNSEDIGGDQLGQKFKKLYFWDAYYELLLEKNSYFSTANSVASGINILNADNSDRGIYTGDALKLFLTDFFNENDGYPATISDNFDKGDTKIFFSSPANFKGIDALEYILNRHVSSQDKNYDPAFLRLERGALVFSFESLKSIFSKAINVDNGKLSIGEYYLETFKIGEFSDVKNDASLLKTSYTPPNALFFQKIGTINNFSADFMAGQYTQQSITNNIVHSYEHESKSFGVDEDRNTITSTMSVYSTNYVEPFNRPGVNSAFANFFPGNYRDQVKNNRNFFTVMNDPNQRLAFGRNLCIRNLLFHNNSVLFRVPGSTHREAGKFIGLDRDGNFQTSDFDDKILGIYFILEVKHIFSGDSYENEIRCIKTYNYSDIILNKDAF